MLILLAALELLCSLISGAIIYITVAPLFRRRKRKGQPPPASPPASSVYFEWATMAEIKGEIRRRGRKVTLIEIEANGMAIFTTIDPPVFMIQTMLAAAGLIAGKELSGK
jgi:hypothetical protein